MNKASVFMISLLVLSVLSATAATHYVVPPGTLGANPSGDYVSWATAATNIQDAVDVAVADELILVTNGTYLLETEISITNRITLRSFNNGVTDRDGTILNGNFPATSNRCLNVNFIGAVIDGFTITNGHAVAGDFSEGYGGGGIWLTKGMVTNCIVSGNSAVNRGGGIVVMSGAFLTDSIISGNAATNETEGAGGTGGGVFLNGGTLTRCVISGNRSGYQGGGIWVYTFGGTIEDCTIANNHAQPLPGVGGGQRLWRRPLRGVGRNGGALHNRLEHGRPIDIRFEFGGGRGEPWIWNGGAGQFDRLQQRCKLWGGYLCWKWPGGDQLCDPK